MAVRNVRRDALAKYKELVKAKEISEDDERKAENKYRNLPTNMLLLWKML